MLSNDHREALRRTEDIYRKAIEDVRDYAIFLMDTDGVVTSWNAGAQFVEDDVDTRELLQTILTRHGADVTAVNSTAAAITELGRVKPDVIISDIGMEGENGNDLIGRIRSRPAEQGGRIPAIALTAYAGATDRRHALLAGFQTHLVKASRSR